MRIAGVNRLIMPVGSKRNAFLLVIATTTCPNSFFSSNYLEERFFPFFQTLFRGRSKFPISEVPVGLDARRYDFAE